MTIRLEPKRPDERRRLAHDWSPFLGDDTIASQTTTSADLTVVSSAPSGDAKSIDFTIEGGTDGTNATIAQSIVTAAGDEETETFILPIAIEEPITLGQAKDYLNLRTSDFDGKLQPMLPRARRWVEDHTGQAIVRRQFVERVRPVSGTIRLSNGPLVSVDSIGYVDSDGNAATVTPVAYPPSTKLFVIGCWPPLSENEAFEVTYTAGDLIQNIDDRLIGAMLALIEGEFSDGFAYPQRAIDAAERCCVNVQSIVA